MNIYIYIHSYDNPDNPDNQVNNVSGFGTSSESLLKRIDKRTKEVL